MTVDLSVAATHAPSLSARQCRLVCRSLKRGAHLPAIVPVGGYTTESVTYSQCDARPMVTFSAKQHHCPMAGTKLYCLVTVNNLPKVVK